MINLKSIKAIISVIVGLALVMVSMNSLKAQPLQLISPKKVDFHPSPTFTWEPLDSVEIYRLRIGHEWSVTSSWSNDIWPPIAIEWADSIRKTDVTVYFDSVRQSRAYEIGEGNFQASFESTSLLFRAVDNETGLELPFAIFRNPSILRELADIVVIPGTMDRLVAGTNGLLYRSNNGGGFYPINTSDHRDIRSIYFLNSEVGWAVGEQGLVLRTMDSGHNWEIVPTDITRNLNDVWFLDSQNGFAVSNTQTVGIQNQSFIYRTVDGGTTWTPIDISNSTTNPPGAAIRNLNKIHFSSPTNGFIIGAFGELITTIDGGTTWTRLLPTITTRILRDITFIDSLNGWTVGALGTVLKTVDGGMNWTTQTIGVNQHLNAIFFIDDQIGWIVGQNGTILKTIDGGVNWVTQQVPNNGVNLLSIYMTDSQNGWAVGSPQALWQTINGGETWTVYHEIPDSWKSRSDQNSVRSDVIFLFSSTESTSHFAMLTIKHSPGISEIAASSADTLKINATHVQNTIETLSTTIQPDVSGYQDMTLDWFVEAERSDGSMIRSETRKITFGYPSPVTGSYRHSPMDHNDLMVSYHTNGTIGVVNPNQPQIALEYPKYTSRRYAYFVQPFFGARVKNEIESEVDSFAVVIAPNYRINPQSGASWSFLSSDGYSRTGNGFIPTKSKPETWPDRWPTDGIHAWPNFIAERSLSNSEEFYSRFDDRSYSRYLNNDEYRFTPIPSEPTRGGLGLEVDMRVIAFDSLLTNIHFIVYDIHNRSDNDYDDAAFMLWIADWVGTPQDDRSDFLSDSSLFHLDVSPGTLLLTDSRPTSSPPEFNGTQIGVAGIRFLEVADNGNQFGQFRATYRPAGSLNLNESDELIWSSHMALGANDYSPDVTQDTDIFVSTGRLTIQAHKTIRIAFAIGVSADNSSNDSNIMLLNDAFNQAAELWNSEFETMSTSIEQDRYSSRPFANYLDQNYPNPFNPSTTIRFQLPTQMNVNLSIYDILGRQVGVVFNGLKSEGTHSIQFDASNLASGIYFYRLTTSDGVLTRKMTLIK